MKSKIGIIGLAFLLLGTLKVSAEEATFIYNDHGKRDPFWKLVNQNGVIINYEKDLLISDMNLEGIMLEASGNVAIINGKIISEKEKIGVFIVESIKATSVILKKGQEEYILKLKKGGG